MSHSQRVLTGLRRFYASNSYSALQLKLKGELKNIQDANLYKKERLISSIQKSDIVVDGKPYINMCANNYLGLSGDAEIMKVAEESLKSRGFGLSSVRFICGTQDIHKDLEDTVSKFHGTEDTILYGSAFDANGGLFEPLLGPEDAIISDELNHASIIDGIRLCKAQKYKYKHMDLADLEAQLKLATEKGAKIKMIFTDGVFSMDGDVAPMKEICDLADKYGAIVGVDECHATGLLGPRGRGASEHCGVLDKVCITTGTFGKALGGASGGFTTGPKEVIEILRQRSRPYLFSNTLMPAIVGASKKALELVDKRPELLQKLSENTKFFRSEMTKKGFTIKGNSSHPISPVMINDSKKAQEFSRELFAKGIYAVAFSYPVVPKGTDRIRVQISAAHSMEQLKTAIKAFEEVREKVKI